MFETALFASYRRPDGERNAISSLVKRFNPEDLHRLLMHMATVFRWQGFAGQKIICDALNRLASKSPNLASQIIEAMSPEELAKVDDRAKGPEMSVGPLEKLVEKDHAGVVARQVKQMSPEALAKISHVFKPLAERGEVDAVASAMGKMSGDQLVKIYKFKDLLKWLAENEHADVAAPAIKKISPEKLAGISKIGEVLLILAKDEANVIASTLGKMSLEELRKIDDISGILDALAKNNQADAVAELIGKIPTEELVEIDDIWQVLVTLVEQVKIDPVVNLIENHPVVLQMTDISEALKELIRSGKVDFVAEQIEKISSEELKKMSGISGVLEGLVRGKYAKLVKTKIYTEDPGKLLLINGIADVLIALAKYEEYVSFVAEQMNKTPPKELVEIDQVHHVLKVLVNRNQANVVEQIIQKLLDNDLSERYKANKLLKLLVENGLAGLVAEQIENTPYEKLTNIGDIYDVLVALMTHGQIHVATDLIERLFGKDLVKVFNINGLPQNFVDQIIQLSGNYPPAEMKGLVKCLTWLAENNHADFVVRMIKKIPPTELAKVSDISDVLVALVKNGEANFVKDLIEAKELRTIPSIGEVNRALRELESANQQ